MSTDIQSSNKSTSVSPEEILSNVSKFIRGSTHEINIPGEELARASLFLLRTLPSSRQAILEYLCSVYDEAVNEHLSKQEMGVVTKGADERSMSPIINEIESLIIGFIRSQPNAWTPIISSWAIDLLGHISRKYSERRSMPHSSSLNELLFLWMTCSPTKSLIRITSECFACASGDFANRSVNALLEASVRHSPHFDWVVAHIGSCFPKTIISRVLLCGLKDYHQHLGGQLDSLPTPPPPPPPPHSSAGESKMSSVVQILSHMALQHARDVRQAMWKLFEDSLGDTVIEMQLSCPMYILHLSMMANLLMQTAVDVFVDCVTFRDLEKLCSHFGQKKPSCAKDVNSLMNLIIHLLMKCDHRSDRVICLLLDYSHGLPKQDVIGSLCDNPLQIEIHFFCSLIMNRLVIEVQRVSNARPPDPSVEVPLLRGLRSHTASLLQMMLSSSEPKVTWLVRLLSCLALHCGEECAAEVLSGFLTTCQEKLCMTHFVQIVQDIQSKYPDIISLCASKTITSMLDDGNSVEPVLLNFIQLCQWEIEEESKSLGRLLISPIIRPLSEKIATLVTYLSSPNLQISSKVMALLMLLRIPSETSVVHLIRLSVQVVGFFFRCLLLSDVQEKLRISESCIKYLRRLSEKCPIQSAILRYLVEGALSEEFGALFGATGNGCKQQGVKRQEISLMSENQCESNCSTSLVFHVGMIGLGLKHSSHTNCFDKADETLHRQLLLEAIWMCSDHGSGSRNGCTAAVEERRLKAEVARNLALVLLELVSPDVIYNSVNWPDEDFMRNTVERDLLIVRKFNENPILWDIMDFVSTGPGGLRICSSILRSIMATLLIRWESSREKAASSQPQDLSVTQRILELMRKGQLLPEPLCFTGDLLPHLTPYEVHLLLLNIWRFMKETSILLPSKLQQGCHPKYTEVIHSILHSNISHLGHLYALFFNTSLFPGTMDSKEPCIELFRRQ